MGSQHKPHSGQSTGVAIAAVRITSLADQWLFRPHVMNAVESYLQHRNGEKARTVRALPCRSRQRYGALT